jgi:uncharacterized protein (TIGR02284 family)
MQNSETLNDLIEINNDRVAGYEKAKGETSDSDLLSLFERMESQSSQFADELKQLVTSEGEKPATGTTNRGKIYRAWMDVKSSIKGDDRRSVLASCEFGEDAAQRAYERALDDKDLSGNARSVVEKQKASLRESHDIIRNLRDKQPA